ncbi:hypothetical protein LCGC14_2066950, partial [marine sediment metagenome]
SVLIEPGAEFFAHPQEGLRTYRLGYSSIPQDAIPEGIAMIRRAIDGFAQPPARPCENWP